MTTSNPPPITLSAQVKQAVDMAVALGKSCNTVFRAQISSQNREAGYIHPTGDMYLRSLCAQPDC
jgi:hypothetical protein